MSHIDAGSTSDESVRSQNESSRDEHDDPEHPFNWPLWKKWTITLSTCLVCFIVGTNATAPAGAPSQINERFRVTDEHFPNSFWPITSWTVGAAVVPMVVLPLMEEHGVRLGYLVSYATFLLFIIPQAVAPNFSTFVSCRFFAGGAAGVLQSCMDGIVADIWQGVNQRGLPVTLYVTALLTGVTTGPVYGGIVAHFLYWRWIFYIQLIICGAVFLFMLLIMRETRFSVIKTKKSRSKQNSSKAEESQTQSLSSVWKYLYDTIALPTHLLCTEPVVFFFTLLSSLSYGIVFLSTQSVAQVFRTNYDFEEYQTGLVQMAVVIGELLGFAACLAQNAWYAHAKTKAGDEHEHESETEFGSEERNASENKTENETGNIEAKLAENRLYFSVPAAFFGLTGGLFFYGWTSYPTLPWILPAIGLAFTGFGVNVVIQAITMYITDAYSTYASSAIAAVALGENIFAGFLPLAAQSMYTNLGFRWASSLLGFAALVLSFAPIILIWKGPAIKRRSKFLREAMQ